MDTHFVSQLLEYFKATYGLSIENAEDLLESQRNLLECLIALGRKLENEMFEEQAKAMKEQRLRRMERGAIWRVIVIMPFTGCLVSSVYVTPRSALLMSPPRPLFPRVSEGAAGHGIGQS